MIPFPGQSVGASDAYSDDGYGWDLYGETWLRGSAQGGGYAGHRVISAGVNWYHFAYHLSAAESYLEPGDATPLDVRWVVEVLSGTGTLVLSDLDDTDYDYPLTAVGYPNALGSITVDGPGTYTLPTSSLSNESIRTAGIGGGALALHIACTSGSIDVQQVKLRAWPATGALGGWSTEPYTGDPGVTPTPTMLNATASLGGVDFPSQADFRAAVAASTLTGTTPVSVGLASSNAQNVVYPEESTLAGLQEVNGDFSVSYVSRPAYFAYAGPGTLGVDFTYPPEEVARDTNDVLYQPTGNDSVTWQQGVAAWGVDSFYREGEFPSTPVFGGTVALGTAVVDEVDAPGSSASALLPGSPIVTVTPSGSAAILGEINLPEFPADKILRIIGDHSGFHGDFPEDSGSYITLAPNDLDENPLRYRWQPAPYRWWDPTGTVPPVDVISRVRHFPRDDGWNGPRNWSNRTANRLGRQGRAGYA